MNLSIRWRLTLLNTLALAVILLAFAGLVYWFLARALYQQLDRTLLAGWEHLSRDSRLVADPEGRLRHWIDEFKEHENLFGVVYDGSGAVVTHTQELARDSVPRDPPA